MFRLKRRGTVEYWEAVSFAELESVTHSFCTRRGGVSEGPFASLNAGGLAGDKEAAVARNLAMIETAFAVSEGRLVLMEQVHGDRVCVLDSQNDPPTWIPGCDGLITSRPGIALAVKTADCVPLLFLDPFRQVIGVAHAGWRGTALGIAGKMVRLFEERFGTRQEDLLVAIGPAIGQCCYEVDAPVWKTFVGRPSSSSWLHASPEQKGR
ncbi:MAG: peptidoglycan editing factor PgeF, partial [Syntrophaceae bacterium]|nr:peptidoglycan editing factor PgeF [Syntrophaceae bacterium]